MKCEKCGGKRAKKGTCKFCKRISQSKYQRSVRGFLMHKHSSMKQRVSNSNKSIQLAITKKEFVSLNINNPDYLRLHAEWVESNYHKWKTPSVDRISDDGNYSWDNIQWMTWRENWKKEMLRKGFDPDATHEYCAAPEEEIPDWL